MMFTRIPATPWMDGEPDGPARGGVFIAWKPDCFRSAMSARCYGAELWLVAPFSGRRIWQKVARYIASFFLTIGLLYRHRPAYVFMLNQPLPLLVASAFYTLPFGVPFALDGHSNAYAGERQGFGKRLFSFFTRKALFTANHNRQDQVVVEAMGGKSVLVPEIPGHIPLAGGEALALPKPSALVVCSFANDDEPVDLIWAAARARPGMTFYVTGDWRKADPALMTDVPANVVLLGFVSRESFIAHMAAVSVVVTLSTRAHIMQTAVEEAISLGVPLVTNKSAILEEVLDGAALFVDLTPESLIASLDETVANEYAFRNRMIERRTQRRANLRNTLQKLRLDYFA